MPFLELSLTLPTGQRERAEAALDALGALSITLRDADADTPDERAIFEPGVGELPLWRTLTMQALFDADTEHADLLAALHAHLPEIDPAAIALAEIADQNWERAWMDHYQPMRFGTRLWIYPSTAAMPENADSVIVRLDPGLAFGTGTHPTTALCLEWLDGAALAGKTLIDYGCGSGVLAVAALKLGAARAIGIDNDPQAIEASHANAERNHVGEKLRLYLPQEAPPMTADILIANILAGPLHDLAPTFAASLKPGGLLALSGILPEQAAELLARYARWFDDLQTATREDWVRITGQRR